MNKLKQYIKKEMKTLDRSLVATPTNRQDLESFSSACGGSGTLIAMQMAIQFGYQMALENIEGEIEN